ncbi:MAG TPA: hypothetical protein VNS49_14660, partial [Streptomyces sp.]|nr:hypothetical protein [Streptomyces sp.]
VVPLYNRADAASYFGVVGGCGVLVGLLLLAGSPFIRRRMGGADVRDAEGPHGEVPGAQPGEKTTTRTP